MRISKAFSLLELIFVLVIIGIIAGIGIPKLLATKNFAKATSIKQDTKSIISAIRTHYLLNSNLNKISDVIELNPKIWTIKDKKVEFIDKKPCLSIEINTNLNRPNLALVINQNAGDICAKLVQSGLISKTYELGE